MSGTLSPLPSYSPKHAQDAVIQKMRKSHPLFRANFNDNDWVEVDGIWTLTDAAIAWAIANYGDAISIHNTGLDEQIALWAGHIEALKEELAGLVVWDKEKRGKITAQISKYKDDQKRTNSEQVKSDLERKISGLESELNTMTHDRNSKKDKEEQIGHIWEAQKRYEAQKIDPAKQESLLVELRWLLEGIQIAASRTHTTKNQPSLISFLQTTRGKVATYLLGGLIGTGVACWNVRNQIAEWIENPVNLPERLLTWDEIDTKASRERWYDIAVQRKTLQAVMDDLEIRANFSESPLGKTKTNELLCGVMIKTVNEQIPPEMQEYIGGIMVYLHKVKYDYSTSPAEPRVGLVFTLKTYSGLSLETTTWVQQGEWNK